MSEASNSRRDVGLSSEAEALPSTDRPGVGIGYFVGINRFADRDINPLRFAVNDAIDFAHAFILKLLLLDPTQSFLAIDQDPSDEDRRRKLDELLKAGVQRENPVKSSLLYRLEELAGLRAQRLFVTFSTHGFVDSIMPADGYASSARMLAETAISIGRFNEILASSKAKLQLVYIDACRNEPLIANPGRKAMPVGSLAQMIESHEGRAVIRSCESRQFSYEFEELGNGLSAHYVLRALGLKARPAQDPVEKSAESLEDGSITLEGVMGYATSAAERFLSDLGHVGNRQSPCLDAPERLRSLPLAIDPKRAIRLAQSQQADEELISRLRGAVDLDGGPFGPREYQTARDLLKGTRPLATLKLEQFRQRARDFVNGKIDAELWGAYVDRIGAPATAPQAIPPKPSAAGAGGAIHAPVPSPAVAVGFASAPADVCREVVNSIGMKFVRIEPGTFKMGSPDTEESRRDNEKQHDVTLTRPYLIAVHHVTRGQFARFISESGYMTDAEKEGWAWGWTGDKWEKVKGASWKKPGFQQADDHPVVTVSWNDATAFCRWLSGKKEEQDLLDRLATRAKWEYRLPTEAQWEFACRNNDKDTNPFNTGATINTDQANYNGNYVYANGVKGVYRKGTTPVDTFPANGRGLFGMHGNAWQWCHDVYGDYPTGPATDPARPGQNPNSSRVLRGGSWLNHPVLCRSAYRHVISPDARDYFIGFRVVLDSR